MVKFTGTTEQIDFTNFNDDLLDLGDGTIVDATKTSFTRQDTPGLDFVDFGGVNFAYNGNSLTAGTINSITVTQGGDEVWGLTGLTMAAATFNNFVAKGDGNAFLAAVFAGNDVITGSTLAD